MIALEGREAFIVGQALKACGWSREKLDELGVEEQSIAIALCLYQFIRKQQALPEIERARNDEQDAKAILLRVFPETLKALIEDDREKGCEPPDLFDEKAETGRA